MDELEEFARRVNRDESVRSEWLFWLGFGASIGGVALSEWLDLTVSGVGLGAPLFVWCALRAFGGKPTPTFKMWSFGFRGGFWAHYGRDAEGLSPSQRVVHARFTGAHLLLIDAALL